MAAKAQEAVNATVKTSSKKKAPQGKKRKSGEGAAAAAAPVAAPAAAPSVPAPAKAKAAKKAKSEPVAAAAVPVPAVQKPSSETKSPPVESPEVLVKNVNFKIDDKGIREFFKDCGAIKNIKWLNDTQTGRFRGIGILTFESTEVAKKAVAKNGQDLMDRQITVTFTTPRPGVSESGAEKREQPQGEKPEGCTTCFMGNIAYSVQDSDIHEFAKDCGTIKAIRWGSDKQTGNFKGYGFVEFEDTAAVDKFAAKNGQLLKDREIRIDFAKGR